MDTPQTHLIQAKGNGCPPGLAKKNNGCNPPGLAKKQRGSDRDYDRDHDWDRDHDRADDWDHHHDYRVGEVIDRDYIVIRDPGRYGLDPGRTYYRVGDDVFRVDRDTNEVMEFVGAMAALLD
ncbi:excinuclease ABC subunit A [Aquicoccus sp. SCR17]|nr:excinuclease ABC subunit A [Carideicomes alvinocaridis]